MDINTEQWKANGLCEHCRRKNYCSKDCTAKKNREARELRNLGRAIFQGVAGTEMTENAIRNGWL